MKTLVIGGGGFLGSHVCDVLTKNGHDVTIFDKNSSKWATPTQKMIIGDILNEDKINEAVNGNEIIYNFAGISDLNEALNKPLDTAKINILGNINILEAARKNNIKRYVYASSVYVHSREGGFYRCSKHASEQYIEEYQKTYGLNYTIIRFGSLYGPRSDLHNGLWRIVKNAIQNKKITYEGNSEAMRAYIHVIDAAIASVEILNDNFINQHLVFTGQELMKVNDLLKMLAEILDISNDVEFIENKQNGHYIRTPYAYNTKLGKKFIPTTHIDLGQGLLELIDEISKIVIKQS